MPSEKFALTDAGSIGNCIDWDQQIIDQARASKGADPNVSILLLAVREHLDFYKQLLRHEGE